MKTEDELKEIIVKLIFYVQKRYFLRIKKIILGDINQMEFQTDTRQKYYKKDLSKIAEELGVSYV